MTTSRRRLSAELALVSRLAAVDTADGARPLGPLDAPSSLDWSRVQRLAAFHAVTPAVQQSLAAAGPLASATAAAMLQDRMLGATANLAKFVRWRGLNAKFTDANLKVVTLRGFATALGVYGDLERRVVGDLDLLVSPNEVLPALAVLSREGYYLTPLWQRAIIKRGLPKILAESSQMTLGGPDGLSVDLQWRVSTRRDGLGTEALLRAAARRDCDGGTYWALPAAYALAQLLDGTERSHRSRLRWLIDVHAAVNRLTVDEATELRRLLEGSGRLVALAEAFALIEALWGRLASAGHFGTLPAPRDRQIAKMLRALEADAEGSPLALLRRGLRFARRVLRAGIAGRRSALGKSAASSLEPARSSRPPITLVTAVYDSSSQPLAGGRGRDIHSSLPSLIDLARLEAALVLYCPAGDVETITKLLAPHFVALSVRPFELRKYAHYDLLMRRLAEHRDRSQSSDRNPALGFLKLQWLATVSAELPFGHQHSYWVDAGLTQHGLFPEGSLTPRLGHAIVAATPANRMFIGATPHRDDNPAYRGVVAALRAVPFEQATIEHRLVSSLFGGRREAIAAVKHRFDTLAHALLRHRIYALEDQVLSILSAAEPELFALRQVEASQVDAA